MKEPESLKEQPYYTLDTSLFHGTFSYFARGKEPVFVRGKAHTSKEKYHLSTSDQKIEPIPTTTGERIYIHLKPYVHVPEITLTIGLYPTRKQFADQELAVGEVLASHEAAKPKEIELGQAQAWYYPTDQTITIWECYFYEPFRENAKTFAEEQNMLDLWRGFEQFLTDQYPNTTRIVTPFNDPIAPTIEDYQTFLRALNFRPSPNATAAFEKQIK